MFLYEVANLVEGGTHRYAECFDFVGATDYAAIIARQNEYRPVPQVGAEDSFATDEEVVAVSKGVHGGCSG